jgi:hypothetical protein
MKNIDIELNIYLEKKNPRKTWVKNNLPNLYEYIIDKEGKSLSEKVYLLNNKKSVCKVCSKDVSFLSIERGYRTYCSKKCSNNDSELKEIKLYNLKKTSIDKYGFDNPSKSQLVKDKISESKSNKDYHEINNKMKKTMIEKYGVDNPSKLDIVKEKKKKTTRNNWQVENVFQSSEIKQKIKNILIKKYGVEHPLKSNIILSNIRKNNIEKWGVDNYTKTSEYKELMFEKYRSGKIKTNLTTDINYVSYKGLGRHELNCDLGLNHTYITNSHLFHARKNINIPQCLVCHPINDTASFKEIEIYKYIKQIYKGEIIKSYRSGLEIDIYLPKLNIGFEFNGLYWHSEIFKDKYYHLNKTNHFKEKGIRIIHIWEDDWNLRQDIIKSQIKNWLSLIDNKIYARKCEVRKIDNIDEYRNFLNNNHIQGYTSATLKIGLYYNNELISLMTFDHFEGRKSIPINEWNLSRFCNKLDYNVVGGASKLLKYFINNYNPTRIISFSDISWSNGDLYSKLGFSVSSISKPNYSYLIDKKRSNKQKWKKSNLVKMGFDQSLSESKIMEDNFGAYKIWDCGQIKYVLYII